MPNDTREPKEILSVRTKHLFSQILFAKEFGTTVEVYRDEADGQLKIAASYNVPGNSPSVNRIDISELSFDDVREIMRIAVDRMVTEGYETVIMELRIDRKTVYFV
jgi:hypothetical protein